MNIGERYPNNVTFQNWDIVNHIKDDYYILNNVETGKISVFATFTKHELINRELISKFWNFKSLYGKLSS